MKRKQVQFLAALVFLTQFGLVPAWAQRTTDIPAGTVIRVRMIDGLSSEEAQVGDTFHATLEDPITVGGRDIFPKGADVSGRVTDVHKSGRLADPGELDLVLSTIASGNLATSIEVEPLVLKGESHTKSNTEKVGGGAALGAIIGAIAGGGKGAAIGAGVGGAAGAGTAAATGKKPAVVESEAVLSFTTVSGSRRVSTDDNSANVPPGPPPNEGPPPDDAARPAAADNDASPPPLNSDAPLFTLRDRRVIRACVSDHASDFPPALLQRPELPSGSERQIRPGGTLPPDAQKQARSLPLACVKQLPALPDNLDRVVYNGRVLLVDSKNSIIDLFVLDDTQ